MEEPQLGCEGCKTPLGFEISMAFQPIVDFERREIFAY